MSDNFNETTDVDELVKILDDNTIQGEAGITETQEGSDPRTETQGANDPATANEAEAEAKPDSEPAIPIDLALGSDSTAPTKLSPSLAVQESFPMIDFKLKSKQELAVILSGLWRHKRNTELVTYYLTGKAINKGREKWTYGEKDMEKLAESLETSPSNLYKACKFEKDYSEEQVMELFSGKFAMSWRNIAQNQNIPSDVFINIYGEAKSPAEFCNAVTKYKNDVNSSKDGSEDGQLEGESQQEESENRPDQDSSRPDDGDPINGEGFDDADLESDNETDDPDDNDESTDSESDQTRTEPIDPPETVDVQALMAKIANFEKTIIEKDERIANLETENAELQKRIKELEGQQEVSRANSDSVEEIEPAEELSN